MNRMIFVHRMHGSLYCHAGALMHDIFRNADNPNSILFLGLICCLYSIIDSDYPCTSNYLTDYHQKTNSTTFLAIQYTY